MRIFLPSVFHNGTFNVLKFKVKLESGCYTHFFFFCDLTLLCNIDVAAANSAIQSLVINMVFRGWLPDLSCENYVL